MSINWEEAPKDATHHNQSSRVFCWMKFDNGHWHYWNSRGYHWCQQMGLFPNLGDKLTAREIV